MGGVWWGRVRTLLAGLVGLGLVVSMTVAQAPAVAQPEGQPRSQAAAAAVQVRSQTPDGGQQFWDVPSDHTFADDIAWLSSTGVTVGRADGSFGLNDAVTRGQMAAFLYRYGGQPDGPADVPGFSDVPAGHVFATEVAWLASTGITVGRADGSFGLNDAVTRGQMAAFLHRFAWEPVPIDPVGRFPDVGVGHVFDQAVGWLAATAVTVGRADGSFGVGDPLTRGQMAAFLFRFDRWMTTGGLPALDSFRGPAPVFDAGAGVRVASHDLDGTVSARIINHDPAFGDLLPATSVFELTVDGSLDGSAEVRLPLSAPLAEGEVLIGLRADGAGADFEPLPVRIEDDGVVLITDSFSWFTAVRSRAEDAIGTVQREVIDPLTANLFANVQQPECPQEDRARDGGYEVASDDGPTVYWCFGRQGDTRVLRVTNNRRYPLILSASGATVIEQPAIGTGLTSLSGLLSFGQIVLPAGATVGFDATITDQRSIVIDTQFDGVASALFQLQVGIETAYELLTVFGARPLRTGSQALDEAVKDVKCRALVLEVVAGQRPTVGRVLNDCLGPSQLVKLFGPRGLLVAPILLATRLVSFLDVQVRALFDIIVGRDTYRIVVSRDRDHEPTRPDPAPPPPEPTAEELGNRLGCTADPCYVSSFVPLEHPDHGAGWLVVLTGVTIPESGAVAFLTEESVHWWRELIGFHGLFGIEVDALGHAFFNASPGTRRLDLIVLAPVPGGFEDFGSLSGRFSSGAVETPGGYAADLRGSDGIYEIVVAHTDCNPSCANGTETQYLYGWTGSDYALLD